MKQTSFLMNRQTIAKILFPALVIITILFSCKKSENAIPETNSGQASGYSNEVIDKWITLQIRLMRNATGIPNQAFSRHYVYAGVAAYEAIAPGLSNYKKWSSRWNGLTGLPVVNKGFNYYLPANANAALAYINKAMFPNANATDKVAIDSLHDALKNSFTATQSSEQVMVSELFGEAVGIAVFNWAETDGYKNASNPYTAPTGPGLWKPTAPGFAAASTPFWGNNRPTVKNSIDNSQPGTPAAYSVAPGSEFYNMVKQVYDASKNLTDDQKAMAMFWRDVPGVTSPGHWLSILKQAMQHDQSPLDKAAVAYALTGAAINDALISCWKSKYTFNMVRPITYIREVMGYTDWNSFLTTPPHPEYSSAHAVLSGAAGEIMQQLFDNYGMFTDHTYDYLNFQPRQYSSFLAIGHEAAQSRFYAGIHYQPSINAGLLQGKKVAENILEIGNGHY